MTGTISFGGIGSGIDTESIVSGLISASQGPISKLKSKASSTHAAVSSISEISSLLSTLKTSLAALDEAQDVSSYKATSSDGAVVATVNGLASPGAFDIKVDALAQEHRSYSTTFTDSSSAANLAGTLDIQVGTGTVYSVAISAGDSLSQIADKINQTDARVTASVFYDGTDYRLQVRGMDTGTANDVTLTEKDGLALGLTQTQAASNAKIWVDGFPVERGTNQFTGVIEGVTLAVTKKTTTDAKITVETDPDGLQKKLEDVINAYNAVVKKVHEVAGFGAQSGSNPVLAADSTLRNVTGALSTTLGSVVGSGKYQTASSIGLDSNNDGTIKLDSVDLKKALEDDPSAVNSLLAGGTGDGVMDLLRNLVDTFIKTDTGLLEMKEQSLEDRAKALDDQVGREQERLDRYADQLRKQFTQMDGVVAANNAELDYLVRLYSGG